MNNLKLACVFPEYAKPLSRYGRGNGRIVGYRPIWSRHGAYNGFSFRQKMFATVHAIATHEAMNCNASWRRAEKRMEAHMPRFHFQRDDF